MNIQSDDFGSFHDSYPTLQQAINTVLSKCFLPQIEGSGGRYSRQHSHLCVFRGSRGRAGIGGFGLQE